MSSLRSTGDGMNSESGSGDDGNGNDVGTCGGGGRGNGGDDTSSGGEGIWGSGDDQVDSGDGGGDGGVGAAAYSVIRASINGDIGADSSSQMLCIPSRGTGQQQYNRESAELGAPPPPRIISSTRLHHPRQS
ncbi:hypothetical protein Tco_0630498 [Tanacetum coccineum]